ncbi:glycerol-3-phosphate phosphatase isoform X3 [Eurytemora carolleeae]|uniref:glycerol-3-phosphate phosphatase isoform X3 n=1 Tax=Eurytemora carolleeae TaxID=1294199 RepID=UPI000C79133C|nr:glycerol-3-phosphate phosphatase isoform X3 [Eurytemora carolleeae]|eukprot:XP_023330011.1 glycerol-3-phosphate phosphatase-like isoform X3 [Eurytemora affinis]
MPCTHINHMSDEDVKSWLNSFDTVMTDCDGVLWVGAEAIQGSPQVINRFRELGKRVFFVTNNSTKHRREYKQKVDTLGFGGDLDEIIGTAYLAASYLEDCGFDKTKKVYVVGSAGITQELDDVGIQYLPIGAESSSGFNLETINDSRLNADQLLDRSVEAVILGFDGGINCWKLMMAASYLANHNTQFIVTNADACFLRAGLILPGTGSMVAAVETAAGRKPIILGKPNPLMFEIVQKRHPSVKPERTLMIGDRADTDILLGKNCGLQTLMVGTGVHSLEKVKDWETSTDSEEQRLVPDKFADRLGDLLDRIKDL